jgi:UDP-N-acetylmuramate--alanine ligase
MIDKYQHVYLLGIGGIGMSALARWFNANGFRVGGYDLTRSALTIELESEGIEIHYNDLGENIPEAFKTEQTLVIVTPAVPKNHAELNYFINNGYDVKKRAEVLGMLTRSYFTIAISGTHGKTTTSSMVAHILKESGKNIFAFIGGITKNYNSNLLLGDSSLDNQIMVVEADEYDRSFLKLYPNMAIVTTMDADHLDIYGSKEYVEESFNEFVSQVAHDGFIACKSGVAIKNPAKGQKVLYFGDSEGDIQAVNIQVKNGAFEFDISGVVEIQNFRLQLPGRHNIMNALAAYAIARELGVSDQAYKNALASYTGVKRRFEMVYANEDITYIDDYAHHPTEIEATLLAAKELYPGKKISLVFQPHLYSRTRDFIEEFAQSLSLADQVILLPIYPAREKPIEGISSDVVLEKVTSDQKILSSKENLMDVVKTLKTDILITMGAGDIDRLVEPIKYYLNHA